MQPPGPGLRSSGPPTKVSLPKIERLIRDTASKAGYPRDAASKAGQPTLQVEYIETTTECKPNKIKVELIADWWAVLLQFHGRTTSISGCAIPLVIQKKMQAPCSATAAK